MTLNSITVERTIDAPAADIFALISDAGRHHEFDGSGTVRGTKSDSQPLRPGSKFAMSMHLGVGYKTVNEVVEFEQDRLIAWRTTGLGGLIGGRIWRYELQPVEDGTLVRETWDISSDKQRGLLRRSKMPAHAKVSMRKTLERLAEQVESRTF